VIFFSSICQQLSQLLSFLPLDKFFLKVPSVLLCQYCSMDVYDGHCLCLLLQQGAKKPIGEVCTAMNGKAQKVSG
jgi:hypothetical protein